MNSLLLDSRIFLWAIMGSADLSRSAVRLIESTPQVYVSVLSLSELKAKAAKGKLKLPDNLPQLIDEQGFAVYDLTLKQLTAYRIFHQSNPDPLDNALLTIAETSRFHFLTADTQILKLAPTNPWIIRP